MFDLLIKLLDEIYELIKTSYSFSKDNFDKYIIPLYSNLEKIHNDYLIMLNNNNFYEARILLEKNRMEKRALREGTREIISVLLSDNNIKSIKDSLNRSIRI
jgi:hypothetical protein